MTRSLIRWTAAALMALALPAFAQKTAGNYVDDSTINASIKAALVGNPKTSAGSINVETYKGVVQLSGFAETQAEKDEAGRVAAGVSGVTKVENNIAIGAGTSVGQKLDDSMVTGRVKSALLDSKDVRSSQINVETRGGVVQLSGFVKSEAMKKRAGAVAAGVSGVKQVDNVLLVKPE